MCDDGEKLKKTLRSSTLTGQNGAPLKKQEGQRGGHAHTCTNEDDRGFLEG